MSQYVVQRRRKGERFYGPGERVAGPFEDLDRAASALVAARLYHSHGLRIRRLTDAGNLRELSGEELRRTYRILYPGLGRRRAA